MVIIMEIEFKAGNKKVGFEFDKIWGKAHFNVNGKKAKSKMVLLAGTTMNFPLALKNHKVRVEVKRPLLFAYLRGGWEYRAFVNNKLVKSAKD
jgi:hypothetical protein